MMKDPRTQSGDPHLDLMRALRLCHPGWDAVRAITFSPDSKSTSPWQFWRDGVFQTTIRPQLLTAYTACKAGDFRALLECDPAVDRGLESSQASASREAGALLLGGYPAPAAEKLWIRYARLVAAGETSGHLAMALAVRAASFHFPPATLIASYVFLEARGGLRGSNMNPWMKMVEDCLAREGSGEAPQIKVA